MKGVQLIWIGPGQWAKKKLLRFLGRDTLFSFPCSPDQIRSSQPAKKTSALAGSKIYYFSFLGSPDKIKSSHLVFLAPCSQTEQQDSTELRADRFLLIFLTSSS
jgi:hypothetical protein